MTSCSLRLQVNVAAVAEREATEEKLSQQLDFDAIAAELNSKSPLEIMDHVSSLREAAPGVSCICAPLFSCSHYGEGFLYFQPWH